MGFFQGTQERVQNSRGRRAISVRATEVLLYIMTASTFLPDSDCFVLMYFCLKRFDYVCFF